jgi:hypothetical protein
MTNATYAAQYLSNAAKVAERFPEQGTSFALDAAQYEVFGQDAVEVASKRLERIANRVHEPLQPLSIDGERTAAANVRIIFDIRK